MDVLPRGQEKEVRLTGSHPNSLKAAQLFLVLYTEVRYRVHLNEGSVAFIVFLPSQLFKKRNINLGSDVNRL